MKVKLKDICIPKQWKTISTSELKESGYPVYGANGIIGYYDKYNHEIDTLLVTCRGATCGYLNISEGKAYINGNAMALDNLSKDVNIKYLYYYLKHRGFKNAISGSAQPQIIRSAIENIEVEIKSKEEQDRVVKVCKNIREIVDKQKQLIELLDLLIKSQFVEMFENKDFNKIKIKELIDDNIKTAKCSFNKNDYIKYIDISSIDNKKNEINGFTEYLFQDAPSRAQQKIEEGDILVSTVRPNLKNIAILKYNDDNLVGSSGYCVLRSKKCTKEYLFYNVLDDRFTDKMVDTATGASYPAIHDEDIYNYEIYDAPIELQNEFANFVNECDKLKFKLQKSLDKSNQLFNSLMQEYFG